MSLAGLSTLISTMNTNFGLGMSDWIEARANLYDAGFNIGNNDWTGAKNKLIAAGDSIVNAATHWGQDNHFNEGVRVQLVDALTLINDNWPSGSSVDMDSILSAMTTASFEQLTSFMGLTQAYKVAVWDAPFFEEYYAALARGFKTWGA